MGVLQIISQISEQADRLDELFKLPLLDRTYPTPDEITPLDSKASCTSFNGSMSSGS